MSGLFDMTRLSFQTLSEIAHRTAHIVTVGGGEGFALMTALFDGKASVIVDQGTMADFLDEEDPSALLLVHVFDTEAQRDVFLASLPLRARSHPR
jgi:hypothetical protein